MATKVQVPETIPSTPEELEELLGDEPVIAEVLANPEMRADFLKKYTANVNKQRPDIARIVADEMQKGLRNMLIENGVNRPDLTPEAVINGGGAATKGAAYSKRAIGAALDREFKDTADFMASIWHNNQQGQDRWRKIRNDYSSIDPALGGFLIPEVLRSELLRLSLENSIVRPRARVIPMDSLRVPFPAIDETSHASTVFGGITAAWTEESGEIGESEARFGRVVLEAKKLAALCEVPNELLQDSIISFAALIDQLLPEAIAYYEDDAFLMGAGAGEPQGVLNSPALVTVTEETSQPNDTIVWENIVKMYARMLPGSLGRAVWVANIDTFPQLATMALAVGTGGSAIWLQSGVGAPPMSILGRPIVFTEKVPTLGGAGSGKDISFIDFGYYLIGDRMQMRAESSPHVRFTSDRTVYRIIERVDGRGWIQSAITPRNGSNTLSPFVTLGERDT